MNAHTPGPWQVADAAGSEMGNARGGWFIQASDRVICSRADWPHRAAESMANARLIAAAVDLYETLKEAAEHIECGDPECPITMRARLAIAKAEGRR